MTRATGGLLLALALATGGCNNPTLAELTAQYFNLPDEGTFTYASEAGLSETHDYAREDNDEGEDNRFAYQRTARRGGFLQDDATVLFEVNDDRQLIITRYFDCVTRCGELSTPVVVFDTWPLEGGTAAETTTLVTLTRNGDPDGERTEEHRFAIGDEEAITTPAGTFESAYTVVWTRTIEDESSSASLVVSPFNGFIVIEDFSGQRFELESGPLPEDDAM
jgi:hypothetical protein